MVGSLAPGGPGGGIPEPCSVMLAGIGIAAASMFRSRRRLRHC
jgi:hypothetical protein